MHASKADTFISKVEGRTGTSRLIFQSTFRGTREMEQSKEDREK